MCIRDRAEVLKTGAQNLGQMGSMDMGGNGGGSMNPAGIMTGMAMGGAMGQQDVYKRQPHETFYYHSIRRLPSRIIYRLWQQTD